MIEADLRHTYAKIKYIITMKVLPPRRKNPFFLLPMLKFHRLWLTVEWQSFVEEGSSVTKIAIKNWKIVWCWCWRQIKQCKILEISQYFVVSPFISAITSRYYRGLSDPLVSKNTTCFFTMYFYTTQRNSDVRTNHRCFWRPRTTNHFEWKETTRPFGEGK